MYWIVLASTGTLYEQLLYCIAGLTTTCNMRRKSAAVATLAALLVMALGQQAGAPSSGSYSSYALTGSFTKGEGLLST